MVSTFEAPSQNYIFQQCSNQNLAKLVEKIISFIKMIIHLLGIEAKNVGPVPLTVWYLPT
jgi:hypothetical protein